MTARGFMNDKVRGAGRSMREGETPGSGKGSSQQRGLGETESCWARRGEGSILETARDGLALVTDTCLTPNWSEIGVFLLRFPTYDKFSKNHHVDH